MFLTQPGSCTFRPPRLLLSCISVAPTTNLVGHNIFTSFFVDHHKKIQTSKKGIAWRLIKSACNSANNTLIPVAQLAASLLFRCIDRLIGVVFACLSPSRRSSCSSLFDGATSHRQASSTLSTVAFLLIIFHGLTHVLYLACYCCAIRYCFIKS